MNKAALYDKPMRLRPITYLPRALLYCTLILCCAVSAQAKEPDWYQIEVLLFAQQPGYQRSAEQWRDHFEPDYSSNPITLNSNPPSTTSDSEKDGAFKLLSASQRSLISAAQRIKASPDLRLLSHLAWRQPVLDRKQAQAILIQTGDQFDTEFELEGTITISRARYLHARTDLFFSQFEPMTSSQELDWTTFDEEQLDFGQSEWNEGLNTSAAETQFVRVATANLNQSRRMRSDELHYIDHPLFGMLVQISPYKLPDPAMKLKAIPLQSLPTKRPLPDSAISPNL